MKTPEDVKAFLRKIGHKGGRSKSPAKKLAAKRNGKLGGKKHAEKYLE